MCKCIICESDARIDNSNIHEPKITCSSCGQFSITDTAYNIIPKSVDFNWSNKIQNWIRTNQQDGFVLITESVIRTIF